MTLTHCRGTQNYFYTTVQRNMGGRKKKKTPRN